jgi:hypothetical protein
MVEALAAFISYSYLESLDLILMLNEDTYHLFKHFAETSQV